MEGQKWWEQKMVDLQCQALSKCVNAVRGARKELVSEIAGVEGPRMALDAAQAQGNSHAGERGTHSAG